MIGAATVAVLVLAVVVLAALGPGVTTGPVAISSDARGALAAQPPATNPWLLPAGQRSSIPVLLVHGYGGAESQMRPMADRLERDGRTAVLVTLPERGLLDIHVSAFALAVQAHALHVPVVDVVGFSLGGIAARQWLLLKDPAVRIRHLVMLATPNTGVALPDDSGRPEQPHCTPVNACGQLKPGSPFLTELDKSPEAAGRPSWLTVASLSDRLVRPPDKIYLRGAENLVVQDVCPGTTIDHGQMDDAPPILGLVTLFLDDRLPQNPTCADAFGAAST
jgi:triacylglycerol lipase